MLHIPFQFDILKITEIFLSDILHILQTKFYKTNFISYILCVFWVVVRSLQQCITMIL